MDEGVAVMPLAIVVCAHRRPSSELGNVQGRPVLEAHSEVSFVKFRPSEGGDGPRSPEVIRQLTFGDQASIQEIHGVFGFEDEGDCDCMVCYAKPKDVLLLPCRHCSVCHTCLRSLRDEKCPLCRSVFSSYVTLPLERPPPHATHVQPAQAQAEVAAPPPGPPPTGGDSGFAPLSGGDAPPQPGYGPSPASEGGQARSAGTAATGQSSTASPPRAPAQLEEVPLPRVGIPAQAPGQARDLQMGRPRGTARGPRGTGGGLLGLGRLRFGDRSGGALAGDSTDTPLLAAGAGAPQACPPASAPEREGDGEDCRSSQRVAPAQGSADIVVGAEAERHGLIQDSEVA